MPSPESSKSPSAAGSRCPNSNTNTRPRSWRRAGRPRTLTWEGTRDRYPEGLPDKVAAQIRHELNLIDRLGYAPYFLTVNSTVRFARSKGILCQGRGSAANSAVCFVLGITSIDPVRSG